MGARPGSLFLLMHNYSFGTSAHSPLQHVFIGRMSDARQVGVGSFRLNHGRNGINQFGDMLVYQQQYVYGGD